MGQRKPRRSMLRLDPGEGRIHTSRQFTAWEGGGEYNVARGLRRCFGLRTAVATAFAENPVGRLVEDHPAGRRGYLTHSLGQIRRRWTNGAQRIELHRAWLRGARGVGCSDRGHTAISQVKSGDFDWESIFGQQNGSRWFHTGGIFAALSETTPVVAAESMDAARRFGTVISYDLNYRDSLWKAIGGKAKAQEVNLVNWCARSICCSVTKRISPRCWGSKLRRRHRGFR